MSRTFRRLKRHLIQDHCGRLSDLIADPSWLAYRQERYGGRDAVQTFQRMVHSFISDNKPGIHHIPGWFNRVHSTKPMRQLGKQRLKSALQTDRLDGYSLPKKVHRPWWW